MKKAAIITLNGYFNYGNRLQNYALQEILRSLGLSVETIIVDRNKKNNYVNKKITISRVLNKARYIVHNKKYRKYELKRVEKFKCFTDDYITETNFSISDTDIPDDLSSRYDYFVIGSDQVWNPYLINGSSIFFATFSPKEKRVAYAPSFGISSIPDEFKENYKNWLFDMKSLSVREEAGAKIVKNLTGRDADVLIDPTLMLSKEQWVSIAKPDSNKIQQEYLLTYFLGKVSNENYKKIKKIAFEHNLKIINLASLKDKNSYVVDPSEFIDYINSASVFFTDSFHGCVFSILLEKPFVVFERIGKGPSMNSRINTLLSKFNMKSRHWNDIKENADMFNVDYSHIPDILESERHKAFKYLKNALNI